MTRLTAILVAPLFLAACSNQATQGQSSVIGYASVDEARRTLLSKPGVQAREQQGWLIVDDRAEQTVWSFTPAEHQAYPAAVKRIIVQRGSGIYVDMYVLCQAEKAPCDRLVEEFKQLNDDLRRDMQRKATQNRGV